MLLLQIVLNTKVEIEANRVVVKIKKYILGQRKGGLNLGTIIIELVSPTKKYRHSTSLSNYVWEIIIKKEGIPYWNRRL